jgi:hypothetical protein
MRRRTIDEAWQLVRNGQVLGVLTFVEADQPSFFCRFDPTDAFSEVASIFIAEREAA